MFFLHKITEFFLNKNETNSIKYFVNFPKTLRNLANFSSFFPKIVLFCKFVRISPHGHFYKRSKAEAVIIFQLQLFLLPCTSQTSDVKRCISCRPRSQSFFKSLLVLWIFSMLAHTSNLFLSSSSAARSSFSSLDFKPSLTCCLQNSFQTTRGESL